MGCKNCKKNNIDLVNGLLGNPKERLFKNNMKSSLWDDGMGGSSKGEKIVLILFAWIPLGFGYYTIINFLISLF
jgi:hypothetical protein